MTPVIRPRFTVTAMTVAALAALASPAAATVSSAVGKPLQAAAAAVKSGNTGAAANSITAARAAAKTDEERRKVAEMAGYVFTRAGQYGKAAAELESIGAPPKTLAALYYQAGQYDKAIAAAKKSGGEDMQILIAQSYIHTGRAKDAITAYETLIKANGPKPAYLENLAGAQYKTGDKAGYIATTTRLIKVDASPARWKALLLNMMQNPMRPEAKLATYYLMQQTGVIDRPADFLEFAKLAIVHNQPGTAQSVIAKAGDLSADPMSAKLGQAAAARSTTALANAPKLATNPATALAAGDAYLGAGQYPQAAAAYATAAKAGGPAVDEARVFGGIAQAKAGNTAAAKAQFAAVDAKGYMKDVADLWGLYASTKG